MAVIEKDGALRGTVANYVYRRYRNLNIIQSKPGRVRQTLNSKKSSLEFGLCCSTAKQLRTAFQPVVMGYDGSMINRLNGLVRRSVQACRSKSAGQRDLHDAELSMLQGFQFNADSALSKVLKVRPEVSLTADRRVRVKIPALDRLTDIQAPARTSYYILRAMVVAFDFKKELYCYAGHRDLLIESCTPAQDWLMDEVVPEGRVVMVSISLHAYLTNQLTDAVSINSKNWNPAELMGCWSVPAAEGQEEAHIEWPARARVMPDGEHLFSGYVGRELLDEIRRLNEKYAKKEDRGMVYRKTEADTFRLPVGDIRFGK